MSTSENPAAALSARLFIGVYPCGLVYADRARDKGGDYARLAFLSYATLELDVAKDCPRALRPLIEGHAATLQSQRGRRWQVSTAGQTVLLGAELAQA